MLFSSGQITRNSAFKEREHWILCKQDNLTDKKQTNKQMTVAIKNEHKTEKGGSTASRYKPKSPDTEKSKEEEGRGEC